MTDDPRRAPGADLPAWIESLTAALDVDPSLVDTDRMSVSWVVDYAQRGHFDFGLLHRARFGRSRLSSDLSLRISPQRRHHTFSARARG